MANRDLTPSTGGRGMAPFGRDPFTSFRREMDRLFDDFLAPAESRSFAAAGPRAGAMLWPSVDVRETDQAYVVTAELPGLEQKDIELNLRDNVLTVSGEKRQEKSDGDNGRSYIERTYGRFERVIPLAADVDADRVEATFKNGILTVTVPKNAQAQDKAKRIEIRPQ
jgi:HSP20 family protein